MHFREQRRFFEILEETDNYTMTEEETGAGRLKVTFTLRMCCCNEQSENIHKGTVVRFGLLVDMNLTL